MQTEKRCYSNPEKTTNVNSFADSTRREMAQGQRYLDVLHILIKVCTSYLKRKKHLNLSIYDKKTMHISLRLSKHSILT